MFREWRYTTRASMLDEINYPYWKAIMPTFLKSINKRVWIYVVNGWNLLRLLKVMFLSQTYWNVDPMLSLSQVTYCVSYKSRIFWTRKCDWSFGWFGYWFKVMQDEYSNFVKNYTWSLGPLTNSMHVLGITEFLEQNVILMVQFKSTSG